MTDDPLPDESGKPESVEVEAMYPGRSQRIGWREPCDNPVWHRGCV